MNLPNHVYETSVYLLHRDGKQRTWIVEYLTTAQPPMVGTSYNPRKLSPERTWLRKNYRVISVIIMPNEITEIHSVGNVSSSTHVEIEIALVEDDS